MEGFGKIFFIGGIMFSCMFGFLIFVSIMTNSAPQYSFYIILAMAVMSFCLSYLYPQFRENKERAKRIKEKGMFISFFFIFGYMLIFMVLFQFNILDLDGYETISILVPLTIITVWISFVVYSKRL
ncbi:uncharacterized membrane protein YobD (UPF0266 family) [Evansella vedderi]|uniref:Uncharacterized membrane protein YobD (UPF0266 family) n=1 Tax=Evansella vedderi TaxID=38282 RepID=A0ABU0A6M1_9BACI|nr:permease [Evansella vedderi]MDQ0257980.1 uncharacterized membrane protein YobD (UPF0266 family) [Evansella vedderi]